MQRRDLLDAALGRARDLDDVQRGEERALRRDPRRERSGTPASVSPATRSRQPRARPRRARPGSARPRPRPVARSARPRRRCPAAAAACAAASASRARPSGGRSSSIPICVSAATAPSSASTSAHSERMSNTSRATTEARAMSACDAPVSSRRRNMNVVPARSTSSFVTRVATISRRSRWRRHLVGEALGQRRREVERELALERRVLRQVGVEQRRVERDLRVGEQHRQLGLGEPVPGLRGARRSPRRRAAPRAPGPAGRRSRGRA